METNLNGEETKTNMRRGIMLIRSFVLKVINNESNINCVGNHTSVQRIKVEMFAGTSRFIRNYGGPSFSFTFIHLSSLTFVL